MPLLGSRGAASSRGFGLQGSGGPGPYEVSWLVVAGGAAGSNLSGGAGGAGGYRTGTLLVIPETSYPITVGAGSNTVGADSRPPSGSTSTFGPYSSTGGGAGGHESSRNGSPGGSGGGAADAGGGSGGSGNAGSYTPSEGSNGSPGGAGGAINGTGSGSTQTNTISGSSVNYAGGGNVNGGGGAYPANTGHGGNGAHWGPPSNGSPGRIVIRYAGAQQGTGGSVSTSGADTVHNFTSTGSATYVA